MSICSTRKAPPPMRATHAYAPTTGTGSRKGAALKATHSRSLMIQPPWCKYMSRLSLRYLTPSSASASTAKNSQFPMLMRYTACLPYQASGMSGTSRRTIQGILSSSGPAKSRSSQALSMANTKSRQYARRAERRMSSFVAAQHAVMAHAPTQEASRLPAPVRMNMAAVPGAPGSHSLLPAVSVSRSGWRCGLAAAVAPLPIG
mmetsp:Transcript_6444/g.16687  ORF Transcript_6444/g.16687 Transcript_6444/m.16687 type:complete len:203 (-) Transcript_6444:108-716(-)